MRAGDILLHGGFADGAGWRGVHDILKKDGFNVSVVQNPTISLTGDVAATNLVIHSQPSSVILVGHSHGGVVITEAGTDPNVAELVYITAFARWRVG
jgi:pimeloyl-ACP methyl ester carboxylesterase